MRTIARGREAKEGRQTIFFTPLSPFGDDPDEEEPGDDLSEPEKGTLPQQVENSSGRRLLDRFSPSTRQRTTVLANQIPCHNCMLSVPPDCIYKVFSQTGERTLFERLSTPRPAPKIVLKSAWQSQQQQQQDTSES